MSWTDGRNLRMDVRWAAGNVDLMRMFAKELVGLQRNNDLNSHDSSVGRIDSTTSRGEHIVNSVGSQAVSDSSRLLPVAA